MHNTMNMHLLWLMNMTWLICLVESLDLEVWMLQHVDPDLPDDVSPLEIYACMP